MNHILRSLFFFFLLTVTCQARGPLHSGHYSTCSPVCIDTIPSEIPVPVGYRPPSKSAVRLEKAMLLFPGDRSPRQVTLEIRDGRVFWNGDIVLFREETYEQLKLEKGNMISYTSMRWPNGVIPYTIEPGHSSVSQINNAINHVNANSNICMVPRTSETNYVEFVDNEPACWSYIGMIGGKQEINVDACGIGATIHEICHAAGMWHEQSRNDRDTYVTILFDNIEAGKEGNFEVGGAGITSVGVYDYASIMHYGTHYFSKNGSPTIQVKSPPAPAGTVIGQRSTLSTGDIASLNTMYTTRNCGGAAFLAVSPTSMSVGNAAQSQTFSVTSNIDWTVTESLSWVTVSPASGSNNGTVTVTFTENTSTSSRSGTITVSGSGVSSQTISVAQSGMPVPCSVPANLALLGKDYSWFAAGWNAVSGATAYSWRYKRTVDASWVTNDSWSATNVLSALRTPCTPYVFQVRAVCGSSFSDWSPELSFTTDGCGDPYCYSYGIAFGDWIKRVDFSNISGASESDYGYTNFTSTVAAVNKGQSYPITLVSGNNSGSQGSTYYWSVWIDFNQDNDFNDAGENVLSQSASKSTSSGTGYVGNIAIPADAASGVTRMRVAMSLNAGETPCATSSNYRDVEDYGINISVPAASLAVSPASLSFVAAGETKSSSITSNVSWSVSESLSWVSVTPASGTNNGTINIQADQNTGTSARSGTVTVSGTGVTAQTIAVSQAGAAAFLTALPTTLDFVSGGGGQNVSISSNISWTASESLSWLTLSTTSGSGNATLTLTVVANTSTSARSGTVTLSGTGVSPVTITVNQAGAAAFLNISPDTLKFGPRLDSQLVQVISNANWTVIDTVEWISLSSSGGQGNRSLAVRVLANGSIVRRNAQIVFWTDNLMRILPVVQEAPDTSLPDTWAINPSSRIHTLILPATLVSDLSGKAIQPGDRIGVFFKRQGLEICAGEVLWTGVNTSFSVYGDNPATTFKEGLAEGERFILKIWQAREKISWHAKATFELPVQGSGINAVDQFRSGGVSKLTAFRAFRMETLSIPLKKGWNTISSYILPEEIHLDTLLFPYFGWIETVRDGFGKTLIANTGVNTIGSWKIEEGYRVRANEDGIFKIEGEAVRPEITPIPIRPGWQIVPFFSRVPQNPEQAFESLAGKIDMVKDNVGRIYLPALSINTIGKLQPTQGYQIRARTSGELRYPAAWMAFVGGQPYGDFTALEDKGMGYFQMPASFNTGVNATLIITASAIEGLLEPGDEVGILSERNILCGAARFNGNHLAIAVWGDDVSVPGLQGMRPGEHYKIQVWKHLERKAYTAEWVSFAAGNNIYQENDLEIVERLALGRAPLSAAGIIPALQVFPNPGDGFFTILTGKDLAGISTLRLYDLSGKVVFVQKFENWAAGTRQTIGVPGIPAGIYVMQLTGQEGVWTEKVEVLK